MRCTPERVHRIFLENDIVAYSLYFCNGWLLLGVKLAVAFYAKVHTYAEICADVPYKPCLAACEEKELFVGICGYLLNCFKVYGNFGC